MPEGQERGEERFPFVLFQAFVLWQIRLRFETGKQAIGTLAQHPAELAFVSIKIILRQDSFSERPVDHLRIGPCTRLCKIVAERGDLLQVDRRASGSIPVCSGPIEGDVDLTSDRSRINRAIETLFGLRGCLA